MIIPFCLLQTPSEEVTIVSVCVFTFGLINTPKRGVALKHVKRRQKMSAPKRRLSHANVHLLLALLLAVVEAGADSASTPRWYTRVLQKLNTTLVQNVSSDCFLTIE